MGQTHRFKTLPLPGQPLLRLLAPLLVCLFLPWQTAVAQTPPTNTDTAYYWQHQASGRLLHVHPADIDDDGISEFITVDANGRIDLIRADGTLRWSYAANETVTAVTHLTRHHNNQPPTSAIAIAADRHLALLNATDGSLIWDTKLNEVPIPDLLYSSGGTNAAAEWDARYPAQPVALAAIDSDSDGSDEILVLFRSGQLQLIDTTGALRWRFVRNTNAFANAQPHMVVADFDQSGTAEIALGFFNNRRFSQVILINGSGQALWDRPVEGRITAVTAVHFHNQQNSHIAIGTNLGQIALYDSTGRKSMPRTVNRPITSLIAANLDNGPNLVVGTDIGKIVAYSQTGARTWTHYLSANADTTIVAMTAVSLPTPEENRLTAPVISVIHRPRNDQEQTLDITLLGSDGRTLDKISAGDSTGLSRLIDINQDGKSELLQARFATLSLSGLGIGISDIAPDWRWTLYAPPSSYLVVDFDQDGEDELLVGAEDGRLHRLLNDGTPRWIVETTGSIDFLATLPLIALTEAPDIVAARNESSIDLDGQATAQGWLSVYQANSQLIWEEPLPTAVTALLVADINSRGRADIIAGTQDGRIVAYTATGENLWQVDTRTILSDYLLTRSPNCPFILHSPGQAEIRPLECITPPPLPGATENDTAITHLLLLDTLRPTLIAASSHAIFNLSDQQPPQVIATFTSPIVGLYTLNQPGGQLAPAFLAILADGTVTGLSRSGIPLPNWPRLVDTPADSLRANREVAEIFEFEDNATESFLITTSDNEIIYLTVDGRTPTFGWLVRNITGITSLSWGDVDGDTFPNMIVGIDNGKVLLFNGIQTSKPSVLTELDVFSTIFGLATLHRSGDQKSDLIVISSNGLAQMFRAQENRPPLLVDPIVETVQGQVSMGITVLDVENDNVAVTLQVFNPVTNEWQSEPTRFATGGQALVWPIVNIPPGSSTIRYRYAFDDTFHSGYLLPTETSAPPINTTLPTATPVILGSLGLVAITAVLILLRQGQQPIAQARRFYRRLQQDRTHTLTLIEHRYRHLQGDPDFLLYLAGQSRQQGDALVAGLADGLFLLADRPQAGLPIVTSTLDAIARREPQWQDIRRWQLTYATFQALVEAPTLTELGLLRPQLAQLLTVREEYEAWSPVLDALLPILTNLRDSERIDPTEDKLVYLNEAVHLLQQLHTQLPEFSPTIERTIGQTIVDRWLGLTTARIEELRGRAELIIALQTKRIIPSTTTTVAFQIRNNGRAAAENIIAMVEETAAYQIITPPEEIALLPPGRQRQVSFTIRPLVNTHFRLALRVSFDDRSHLNREIAFGDMVNLLPPSRDFAHIPNPYMPGTPLRQDSELFVGREDLFGFIAENAGRLAQRNVLILVGQRRTGKTSALLRLGQHLPPNLLPVYIDCQSLGVMPGMPALFYDLAWHIADTLALRDIAITVPEIDTWEDNPSKRFQRDFLPMVRTLLPGDTHLLLVFDEFEAFENLVQDGILPPTFFPYLRHLMQHSEDLGFVFVGTRRLEEMTADYWSVLFNIALYQKIGYLNETAAARLISDPVAPYLIYDDLAIDKILRVTAGHPYFLQLVCYTLVKHANARQHTYITISDVNEALDEMLRLGEVHFAYLWQRSSHTERALLTAFAHLADEDVMFHPQELLAYLEPYGIKLTPADVTTALNSLVERDIVREVTQGGTTLYEQHVGLVGLWVARHKSLSRLHATNGSTAVSDPVRERETRG